MPSVVRNRCVSPFLKRSHEFLRKVPCPHRGTPFHHRGKTAKRGVCDVETVVKTRADATKASHPDRRLTCMDSWRNLCFWGDRNPGHAKQLYCSTFSGARIQTFQPTDGVQRRRNSFRGSLKSAAIADAQLERTGDRTEDTLIGGCAPPGDEMCPTAQPLRGVHVVELRCDMVDWTDEQLQRVANKQFRNNSQLRRGAKHQCSAPLLMPAGWCDHRAVGNPSGRPAPSGCQSMQSLMTTEDPSKVPMHSAKVHVQNTRPLPPLSIQKTRSKSVRDHADIYSMSFKQAGEMLRPEAKSKNEEWFIDQLRMLEEKGIPKGTDALLTVIANKCGSLAHAFAKLDYNGNGELSLMEFAGGLALLLPHLHGTSAVRILTGLSDSHLFRSFDTDNNGTISLAELAGVGAVGIRRKKSGSRPRKSSVGGRMGKTSQADTSMMHKRAGEEILGTTENAQMSRAGLHGRVESGQVGGGLTVAPSVSADDSEYPMTSCPGEEHISQLDEEHISQTENDDIPVLMAQWTTMLAMQRSKCNDGASEDPRKHSTQEDVPMAAGKAATEDSDGEEISSGVQHMEKMMQEVFKISCGGYRKRNENLMTRPQFFQFFTNLSDDLTERKLHSLYDSQLELQLDLTMATFGYAISEGLNYESFRVCLHRAAVQMKLNLHHLISDLVADYEKHATARVAAWKREREN